MLIPYCIPTSTIEAKSNNHLSRLDIIKLFDTLKYEKVISYYSNIDIKKLESYDLIMFSYAVNQEGKDIKDYIKKDEKSPENKFLVSYWNVLNGHINSSLKSFQSLIDTNNTDYLYYGIIGMIETYIFTEDYINLKQFIDNMEKEWLTSQKIIDKLKFYKLLLYSYINDFSSLEREISQYNILKLEDDIDFQIIKIRLLINKNKLSQALTAVDNLLYTLGELQDLILIKYDIINLIDGKKSGARFINSFSKKSYWKIRLTKFFSLLSETDGDERKKIVDRIVKIGVERKKDIPTLLAICNSLIDSGFTVKAATLSNYFYTQVERPYYFFLSNLFYAKFHILSGQKDIYLKYLDYAKNQNPFNENLLWFLYDISVEHSDYNDALEILNKLLENDPYNIELLALKGDIYGKLDLLNDLNHVKERISSSNRYIPTEVKFKLGIR